MKSDGLAPRFGVPRLLDLPLPSNYEVHGYPWNPGVRIEPLGAHGFYGDLRNPWVPMESMRTGTHGMDGYPWNPWVPMKVHGDSWVPRVPMDSVGTHARS